LRRSAKTTLDRIVLTLARPGAVDRLHRLRVGKNLHLLHSSVLLSFGKKFSLTREIHASRRGRLVKNPGKSAFSPFGISDAKAQL
jgi:hypothetical protein